MLFRSLELEDGPRPTPGRFLSIRKKLPKLDEASTQKLFLTCLVIILHSLLLVAMLKNRDKEGQLVPVNYQKDGVAAFAAGFKTILWDNC